MLLYEGDVVREILGEDVRERLQGFGGWEGGVAEEDESPEGGVLGRDAVDGAAGGGCRAWVEGVSQVAGAAEEYLAGRGDREEVGVAGKGERVGEEGELFA